MTFDEVSAFALGLPEATEDHPFGPEVDVFKVAGKVFGILRPDPDRPLVSLKCEPGLAELLREKYLAVTPGYHLNKRHWNTVELDGSVPSDEVAEMVRHSYERVVAGLPKEARERLRGNPL